MDDQNKPWKASFNDQENINKKYSRTENRKKTRRVSLVVGLLITLILILSFVPVYSYLKTLNNSNESNQGTAISALNNNKTKTSDSKIDGQTQAEKNKLKKKKDSEAKESSEQAAKESSEQAAKESSEQAAAEESSEQAESTVKMDLPPDRPTLYGFAAAHNISVDQLYSLNPGLTSDNYAQWVGKDIKIK